MLRPFERKFKRFLSRFLRRIVGVRQIAISHDATFERILIVRQHNQLGDMLCCVPLLRALRTKYPTAFIALMTSPVNHDIMLNNRYVDKVINFDKRQYIGKGIQGLKHFTRFVRELRAQTFDLAIVPSTVSTSFTSDLLAYLSGAQSRIGAEGLNRDRNASSFFFTTAVPLDWTTMPHRHQTLRNLDIGSALNLSVSNLSLEATLDSNEINNASALIEKKKKAGQSIIVYHPGAGKVDNRWSPECFAQVANALAKEHNVATFVTSGPMDRGPVSEMLRPLCVSFELIDGKPIREVACYLSAADLVISNDTGIMHVAAAVGVPVLSLFGPTDPEQWAPIGSQHRYIHGVGGDIHAITIEEVLRNAREMLTEIGATQIN